MADQCKNGCGKAADPSFAGCCSVACLVEFSGGMPVPVTEAFVAQLRGAVENVQVDIDARLPRDEDDIVH